MVLAQRQCLRKSGGGGGHEAMVLVCFVFWRRLLASRPCTSRPSVGPNVFWLCHVCVCVYVWLGLAGGGWHKASVSDCLPLAAPIGLSPPLILTLCGPERVLIVSTEPPDDLSCLTTPGVGRPGAGAVARAVDQGHPDTPSESMRGFADSSTDLCALGCASAGSFL